MEKKKLGLLHILIAYINLCIPKIEEYFSKEYSKDLFIICFILSLIIIGDAKMRYNSIFVKIAFWNMWVLFVFCSILILT